MPSVLSVPAGFSSSEHWEPAVETSPEIVIHGPEGELDTTRGSKDDTDSKKGGNEEVSDLLGTTQQLCVSLFCTYVLCGIALIVLFLAVTCTSYHIMHASSLSQNKAHCFL